MTAVGHDIRIALRSLRATPWFSGLVVIILTLATGINTGLYGVIYSALFRPLGVANLDRLIYIYLKWDWFWPPARFLSSAAMWRCHAEIYRAGSW
jgi:hypothetical protein